MPAKVRAIYRDGVFLPLDPVPLAEDTQVLFEPEIVEATAPEWNAVYAVLLERFESGEPDVAEKHDEPQP